MGDYEVEFKAAVDHERVRRKLERVGAEPLGTIHQTDIYYDPPDRNFGETDEALRVRREREGETETIRVTYKGPRVDADSKTRKELETTVGDAGTAAALLEALGFEEVATVEKTRERFRLDRYLVTLDSVADIGEFLEVETAARADDLSAAREGARAILQDLEVDSSTTTRTSYLEMKLDGA